MIEKTVRRFFKTDLKARLYGNAFWSLAGAVLSKLIFFIILFNAANILGKMHYSEFGMMNSTVLMFVALASSISVHSFHSNHLGDEIRIATIIFFVNIINGAQNDVLSGFERYNLIDQFSCSVSREGMLIRIK